MGNLKGPEILRCYFIDRKLGDVKSYLYMAPPDLKKMFDDWAKKVSDFENPDNIWYEEEVVDKVTELNNYVDKIFKKINEYIEKDERELYSISNGPYKAYLKRIKDFF